MYNTLSFIEQIENFVLWKSFRLPFGYVVIDKLKIEELIDCILVSLPEDIYISTKKTSDKKNNESGIYYYLKEFEIELSKYTLMNHSLVKLETVQKLIGNTKFSFKFAIDN